jgi:urease accessory protein
MLIADRFTDAPATDRLTLTYDQRRRSRHYTPLESGEEFGYVLPPGTVLHHGDRLAAPGERVIEILAAVESVLEARTGDALQLARAAYHLGNRHVAVEVGSDAQGGYLRLQADHVLAAMLEGLGCTLATVDAAFDPEGGAYGHRHGPEVDPGADDSSEADLHDPGHGPHRSKPRIHEFRK